MSCLLAIDQSTSATKAILFDGKGEVLTRATLEHRQIYPQPGWVEHDAEEIWQNTLRVIEEVVRNSSDEVGALRALSITNQRETFVVFDRRTGRPLHHAIVWPCRRGDSICQHLRDEGRESMVRSKTGLRIDTYFSASKLKWLITNSPEIASKLKNGEALIGT